jgi:hypothetical protein
LTRSKQNLLRDLMRTADFTETEHSTSNQDYQVRESSKSDTSTICSSKR